MQYYKEEKSWVDMAELYGHEAPEDVNKDLLCTCLKRVALASEFFLYLLNLFRWLHGSLPVPLTGLLVRP